jgi:flagellar motor switch protein FliN/FliY
MSNQDLAKMADDIAASAAGTEVPPVAPVTGVGDAPGGAGGAGGPGAPMGRTEKESRNLDLILDIPLRVTVELGRAKMVVSELLNLSQGSVIELSKLAGEPLEVLVNDKLVARGEAVVVNEKFGVRLTDIISPAERVNQLK